MKFNVNKITSVTLLTSMILTAVSPPSVPLMVQANDQMITETEADLMVCGNELETESEAVTERITEVLTEVVTEGETASERETEGQSEVVSEHVTEAATEQKTEAAATEGTETVTEKESSKETETSAATEKAIEKEMQETESKETEQKDSEESGQFRVKVSSETDESMQSAEDPKEEGKPQRLKIDAVNESDSTADLRLYIWDYDGIETDVSHLDSQILTDACSHVYFPQFGDQTSCSVSVISDEGEESQEQLWVKAEYEDGQLKANYLEVTVPSGFSLSESVQILNDQAEKVIIQPVLVGDTEELFENCIFTWNPSMEEETESMETETEAAESETEYREAVIPEGYNREDFATKRLILKIDDEKNLLDGDTVLERYDDILVIEYPSVENCVEAYLYYTNVAELVEPDTVMEIASDTGEEVDPNPQSSAVIPDGAVRKIALLDTGASAGANVIERVSMIDNALEGHTHGNQMVNAIVSQNPDAQILSIRVIRNDGRGTVSSIIAGMEYAMEHGASIINLSLSAGRNTMNEILETEIQKASEAGVMVVGAAGNNGSDAIAYMPGCVKEAWIIGACNEEGVRIASSNFGATVDYNVTAGTTSEAAARFSGMVSLAGVDALKVNTGKLFATDYVPSSDNETETEAETESETECPLDQYLSEEELADMAGEGENGKYPARESSQNQTVRLWTRDTAYDLSSYNPYRDDENVVVTCVSELPEAREEQTEVKYICSLKDDETYKWNLFVTFEYTDDRSVVSEGSELLETLMPESVDESRNEGYGGIVPEKMGETVEGKEFTVLKDDTSFDILGLLIDYNPETFKVNDLADDGGFDVAKAGTYTVTYEMSYFLYPDYTWYVANKIHVVEKDSLKSGIYLTTTESTLMFRKQGEGRIYGYGDLLRMEPGDSYVISCVDPDYEVEIVSSDESVPTDFCTLIENEDATMRLTAEIPEEFDGVTIFSMHRPGYESAKLFTGGGWVDGETYDVEEAVVSGLTEEDMDHLENTVLGKVDENDEEYFEIAASSWTNVESKNISGKVKTGSGNTTNNSWVDGPRKGCNYGTAQITDKKDEIADWITAKGYDIDTKDLSNFRVNCSSGHDYLGLWPNRSYNVTFKCYIQKSGNNYRLKITCSLHPGSDKHGNYQSFYGSKVYTKLTNGAKLKVYKRFQDPTIIDINPDMYGQLKTTFSIYPASAYNTTTKVLDRTVEPEDTIYLDAEEEDAVYGESDILDPGTYYVVESSRIKGCTLNTDIYGPITIKETDSGVINLHDRVNNADYPSLAPNNWIYNNPMVFSGTLLTKKNTSGLPVADAIYKVEYSNTATAEDFLTYRTWYFRTDTAGNLNYGYTHYVPEAFTYNGKTYKSDPLIENASKTYAFLPYGFLRITEVKPPSEIYDIDPKTYTIELAAKTDAAGQYTIRNLTVKNGIQTSIDNYRSLKMTVEKTSKAAQDVLALDSYSLEGATFGVFSDSACTKPVQLYSDENLKTKVADNHFRTDASGKAPVYYLQAGSGNGTTSYYVKELTAPKGHKLAATPVEIVVRMPADAMLLKTASFTGTRAEDYNTMPLDILVKKLSMHGNPIKGVVFKVCYYDDTSINAGKLKKTWYLASDEAGAVLLDQAHVYMGNDSMKSSSFYTDPASGKIILPSGGYVTLQEVKVPAQYVLDDTVHEFATGIEKVVTTTIHNDTVPCKIRLKKFDQSGKKALKGVQFELKFVKAAETDTSLAGEYKRLLKEGETTVVETNQNGEAKFENLAHGKYEITEIKTVAGQTLLKDKIEIELPITMTKEEAQQYGNVDFTSAKEDTGYTGKWFFYDCLYEITNEPQFSIPQTGGFGSWGFGYLGIFMPLIAGFYIYGCRKKKPSED